MTLGKEYERVSALAVIMIYSIFHSVRNLVCTSRVFRAILLSCCRSILPNRDGLHLFATYDVVSFVCSRRKQCSIREEGTAQCEHMFRIW